MATVPTYIASYTEEVKELEGNIPFQLQHPDTLWFLLEGSLYLFFVEGDADSIVSGRNFLMEAKPGDLLFPLFADIQGVTLFAVGAGARLAPISLADYRKALATSDSLEGEVKRLEEWIASLLKQTLPDALSSEVTAIHPGETLTLDANEVVTGGREPTWVELQGGSVIDFTGEVVTEQGRLFPISNAATLRSDSPGTVLRGIGTEELLRGEEEDFWLALRRFHRTAGERLLQGTRSAERDEEERLRNDLHSEEARFTHSIRELASILEEGKSSLLPTSIVGKDPLFEACARVGRSLRIKMVQPSENYREDAINDQMQVIASENNVRVRRVTLKGEWWKSDHGPLVGFTTEGKPVALIQKTPTKYLLHEVENHEVVRVDKEVAQRLIPRAYMFIMTLGDQQITSSAIFRFLVAGMRADALRLLLAGTGVALLGLALPIFIRILFDDIIPSAQRSLLFELGLLLVGLILVSGLFELVRGFALLRIDAMASLRLEGGVIDRLLRLPPSFFKNYLAGDLANRALGVVTIKELLTSATLNSLLTAIFALSNILLLFTYNLRLALVGTVLAFIQITFTMILVRFALRIVRKQADRTGKIAGLLYQLVAGIAKIRIAGGERRAFSVWATEFAEQSRLTYSFRKLVNLYAYFGAGFPLFTTMIFFICVLYMIGEPSYAGGQSGISTGTFAAILLAFSQFLAGVIGLGSSMYSLLKAIPLYERSKPILESPLELTGEGGDPGRLTGEIEVNGVDFRYHQRGQLILEKISLKIEPGEMVAIVGPSGSGKSTLLRLLLGFEIPEAGSIYFNKRDLSTLDLEKVRKQIGVVLQNDMPIPGSIFENIVGESSTLTVDDAWEAAENSGLAEDIKAMPMQMFTMVNEGGTSFSGGQRQRMTIARAIVRKPPILLFDEATSALDNRTQKIVSESLAKLNMTRIVIAHRLSTIRGADKVIVMANGRIVESGSYDELSRAEGIFAKLAARQLIEEGGERTEDGGGDD